MAVVSGEYPLYFDATNEKGVSIAGLNFVGNAFYYPEREDKENVASYELIPRILCESENLDDVRKILSALNITDKEFDKSLSPAPLHWIISDKNSSITVEQTKKGLFVYDNPVGVLTNNPPFELQLFNLNNYHALSSGEPENRFSEEIKFDKYSYGMGGFGMPGDLSSASRFVKACFTKFNSVCDNTEEDVVAQFFHILYSVYQQKGCVKVNGDYEFTNYTSCCNADKGIYYYTTYDNFSIRAVDMHRENLDGKELVSYEPYNKAVFEFR